MERRPLTFREHAVLTTMLALEFDGVEQLREQVSSVQVVGGCTCGCPSVNLVEGRGAGMRVVVNAVVNGSETFGGLSLYTVDPPGAGGTLGGIEWVGPGESDPAELPAPDALSITLATN